MKNSIALMTIVLALSACAGLGSKRAPEVVASCFSEGDNQALFCKSQRTTEDGKIATTRCIGSQNPETTPSLRGKCAEKICSEGSQTDCQVRGEHLVIEKYAELATAKLFNADEAQATKKIAKEKRKSKLRTKLKSAPTELEPAAEAVATNPSPDSPTAPPKKSVKEKPEDKESMSITLTPIKKSRTPASATSDAQKNIKSPNSK